LVSRNWTQKFLRFVLVFSFLLRRSVHSLTQAIERQYAIPANSQVLLVSGGETLVLTSRVCSYSAGTDTNPIFMFCSDVDQKNPPAPWPSIENGKQQKNENKCVTKLK
jgi:RB1-inducible coiled-coil protein 1